jgi:hypothetical protein
MTPPGLVQDLKYPLKLFYHRTISFIHSSVHVFPVLVKGVYQTESYSLHVMQLVHI